MAFGVFQYKTDQMLHDPNYVRFEVNIVQKNFSTKDKIPIKFHECSTEDYARFYQPTKNYEQTILRAQRLYRLYCIDEGQDLLINGDNILT